MGYFKRERLTDEKFLPDPRHRGGRLYRTGDEVRKLADGRLEFIGRLDQQVKLRGYRIELGEIESAMTECEGVRDAVAVLHSSNANDAFLVGFYTGDKDVPTSRLRELLAQRLPAYMIPNSFERLDALPLTPNGKTDRRSLASLPLTTSSAVLGRTREDLSSIELRIADMWRKLFQGETITADADFFELGGGFSFARSAAIDDEPRIRASARRCRH